MPSRNTLFHPLIVLSVSLGAAAIFSLFVIWRYDGAFQTFLLYYFAPIGVPFVAYLLDRFERMYTLRPSQWVIDGVVVALSLVRAYFPIPLISGHALFLTYAVFSTRSWVARAVAFIVMIEVCYLKVVIWRDITLVGGVVLGCAASLLFQRLHRDTADTQ